MAQHINTANMRAALVSWHKKDKGYKEIAVHVSLGTASSVVIPAPVVAEQSGHASRKFIIKEVSVVGEVVGDGANYYSARPYVGTLGSGNAPTAMTTSATAVLNSGTNEVETTIYSHNTDTAMWELAAGDYVKVVLSTTGAPSAGDAVVVVKGIVR